MKKLFALLLLTTPCYGGNVYIDQVGNGNVYFIQQTSSGNSEAILLNKGDANSGTIVQEGSGNHEAFIGTPPTSRNYDGTIPYLHPFLVWAEGSHLVAGSHIN